MAVLSKFLKGGVAIIWRGIRFFVENPRLAQSLFVVATLGVAAWVAKDLLTDYLKSLTANRIWIEDVKVLAQDRMLRVVFERSTEAGLIWAEVNPKAPYIGVVSCENMREGLPPEGIVPRGELAQKNREVLSLLCTTDQGVQIREEIRQWNDSEYLLAVRDNRRKPAVKAGQRSNVTCDPPRPDRRSNAPKPPSIAFATIPRRCLLNRWDMFMLIGDRNNNARTVPIESRGPEPSATDYDFIASDAPLYMTDWASLTPIGFIGPLRDVDYRLTSDIMLPSDGVVRVDLVGVARRIAIPSASIDVDPARLNLRQTASIRGSGGIELRIGTRCDQGQAANRDCTGAPSGTAYAYIIEIEGPPGRAVRVEIIAQTQRNVPRGLLAELRKRDVQAKPASVQQPVPVQQPAPVQQAATPGQSGDDPDADTDDDDEEEDDDMVETWSLGQRTPNLIVECPNELPTGVVVDCTVSWREPADDEQEEEEKEQQEDRKGDQQVAQNVGEQARKTTGRAATSYQIRAADEAINLVTPDTGEFTPESLELGLAPIVGGGAAQWGSMAWAMRAGGRAAQSANLTINVREQRAIREVLEARRARCSATGPKDCIFRNPAARAVVTLIDASKERAGEVRAMVSWPPGQTGSHVWDLAAAGGSNGRWRGAATARTGWSVGYDGLSQPGSTFKVVTALAAIEAVLKRENSEWDKMRQLLEGRMDVAASIRFLELRERIKVAEQARSRDCRTMPGTSSERANMLYVPRRNPTLFKCLQNFEEAPHARHFRSVQVTHCPSGAAPNPRDRNQLQFSLCEALMQSSNLFFGGLSLKLDGPKVLQGGREREGKVDLEIQAMADRLLPPSSGKQPGYDLMRGTLPRSASLLRLDQRPITIEAGQPRSRIPPDRLVMTATSGYGQNVYAAPLAIGSIYASIATNSVVRPRFAPLASIPANAAEPVRPPLLQAGAEADRAKFLAILRAGLHGVVARPRGSATSYFSPGKGPRAEVVGRRALLSIGDQPRLFGKTGTATISNRFNTLWFAGWIDGSPNRGIKTPLAFVCQAIQQPRGQKLTGGGVCGPVIRDILFNLDQMPGDQTQASPLVPRTKSKIKRRSRKR